MTTKYTPGPWRVEDIKAGTLINIVPKSQQKAFTRNPWVGDYWQIASVATSFCRSKETGSKSHFEHIPLPEGQALANARLIAAAPELLDLAREFEGYLALKLEGFRREYPEDHCIVQTAVRYQSQARAAIAKATGTTL